VFRRALILILFFSLAPALFADDLVQRLPHLEKQVLLLRGFYQDSLLRYDQSGVLKHRGDTGPWTTAFVYIKSFDIKNDKIRIDATRVVQIFDRKKRRFQPTKTDIPIILEIDIDLASAARETAIMKLLSSVFIGSQESLAGLVPDYWRSVIERLDQAGVLPPEPANVTYPGGCGSAPSVDDPCRIGKTVKPPKPISTNDPPFSDIGRIAHLRGTTILATVVDETGHTKKTRVVTPLGCGFDDRAVDAVSRWLFNPATRDGKPVPVQITVEVNFNWTQ
jgi:TonB family protein